MSKLTGFKEDNLTCRHLLGGMTYNKRGAKCGACGREWFSWVNKKGRTLWLTNPRMPKK